MNKKTAYPTQLLNVNEAANLIGVNPGTIRRWVHNKQLKGIKVGIRGDWRFTKDDVLEMVKSSHSTEPLAYPQPLSLASRLHTSSSNLKNVEDYQHLVQFYENDEFLLKSVSDFISAGDAAIIVATPNHREKLEKTLVAYWPDLSLAKANGSYISLDAKETLEKFMVNGMPEPGSFFEVVGNVIMRASRGGRRVRIFGEMVALLWAEGNKKGAIKLEDLWNDLQRNHFFSLYCAYPMHGFGGEEQAAPFSEMNRLHSQVFPAESYHGLDNNDARLREIASLQQQAKTLKEEIVMRKKTEKLLKISELRYRRLFEAAKDGVIILDFDSQTIIDTNPIGEEMLGISRSELIGKKIFETNLVKSREEAHELFEKLKLKHTLRYDLQIPDNDNETKVIEVYAIVYKEDEKLRVQCDMRDITSRKKIERQKDDFMSIVSHELKTPVTSLKAYAQVLERRFVKAGDTDTAKYFGKMDGQINKLTGLISDLLDITKIQSGRLQFQSVAFDFDELVDEIIEEVQRTTETHTIIKKGKTASIFVGDRDRIGQVITNLFTNAIKYSPDAKEVAVTLSTKGNEVCISVRDFGVGISKGDQEFIFDRFYRESGDEHSSFPGLGLGLYISSRIVTRHDGKIWVDSQKGKGSTFFVTLPLKNVS